MTENDPTTPRTLTPQESAEFIAAVMEAAKRPRPATVERDIARTEHYTELRPVRAEDPLAAAWEVYRREVGRLLAEGHAGKFLLVGKRGEIGGLYATFAAAVAEGERRFPGEPVLAYEVRERHPILRSGYIKLCLV